MIVTGGLNDLTASASQLHTAASRTLVGISTDAKVFVIGPTHTPARGATFVAASGWDLPYLPDATHLSVEGHRLYAEHVAEAIRG